MSRNRFVVSRETVLKPFAASTDADKAYKLSHAPQFKNAEQYIQEKIKMLVKDFRIPITETEIEHLNQLATEIEVKHIDQRKAEDTIDRAVRQIINDHWR